MVTTEQYRALLEKDPDVAALFGKLPFALHGHPQNRADLARTLANEAGRLAELPDGPRISLLTAMWNTPPAYLEELIASCRWQTWPQWELVLVDDASTRPDHLAVAKRWAAADSRIKLVRSERNQGISGARNVAYANATGDFVGILDHDDLLHPQTLGLFARYLATQPAVSFLFCNEVKLNAGSTMVSEFYAKPGYDLATLERSNYICHFAVQSRAIAEALLRRDGVLFRSAYDGAEDHDYFLRLASAPAGEPAFVAAHLPVFGYYWRKAEGSTAESLDQKPYVRERGLKMLQAHFARIAPDRPPPEIRAAGERGANLFYSSRFKPAPGRRLGVVIPFRDGWPLTRSCLEALERQETSLAIEIVLVDNGSSDPATASALGAWLAAPRRHRYRLRRDGGAFNFARLNNQGVAEVAAAVDFVLLLNNDVELTSADALEALAGELDWHADVGFVGLRLWYPGGQELQHGGIKVAPPLAGLGFYQTTHVLGAREFVADEHVAPAVTFACAMCRIDLWRRLGGLDEVFVPNGYGDVDACLRAAALGYRSFYLGTVEGVHHESKTRRPQSEELEQIWLSERYGGQLGALRSRSLGYDVQLGATFAAGGKPWFEMQLRYRVADAINDGLKRLLGPWHRRLKRLVAPRLGQARP
jgi:GT2 family glycosyltransferase